MEYTKFKERVLRKIEKYGEDVTINGKVIKVFLQPLDSGRLRVYLDDTEAQSVLKPGLFLISSPEADLDIGDTLMRDDRTFTVHKVAYEHLGNLRLLKYAILS